jgi:hypothetical protein
MTNLPSSSGLLRERLIFRARWLRIIDFDGIGIGV